ncbi:hypothetical protein EUZ85_17825 [Hahella sp. KA22]|uniref:hypothetical protein n=1 Tax=Hahella sp. KA22 TaxID=1628392 RepID=UPI000FDDE54D|nr:hypothetical protein [Hahella sp. KA22]AZZ92478.1 hypothetical protein ENC22_15250 [Hahella sp. KA22]QAY55852.1 hypothetical protein EUZ85_17825 [Hahella sp. KA22]
MSDAFIVAGKLHLSESEYEAWLASPAAGVDSVSDWDAMYRNWYWSDKTPRIDWESASTTTEQALSNVLKLAMGGPYFVLLKYDADGEAFRFFVMSVMGPDERLAEKLMALLRSASAFKTDDTPDAVLYWPELSGAIDFEGMLSVALVRPQTSQFADMAQLKEAGLDKKKMTANYKDLESWYGDFISNNQTDRWQSPEFVDARFL